MSRRTMPSKSATREDRRLERLTDICLDLPEAIRERHATHAAFTVRDRKFSYYLDDHHGDGIVALCARAAPGVNDALIASDADRFYKPAYIGPRGWVALRLDVGRVDWDEVAELVIDSYRLVAPKRLVAALDHGPEADGRSSTRRRGAE